MAEVRGCDGPAGRGRAAIRPPCRMPARDCGSRPPGRGSRRHARGGPGSGRRAEPRPSSAQGTTGSRGREDVRGEAIELAEPVDLVGLVAEQHAVHGLRPEAERGRVHARTTSPSTGSTIPRRPLASHDDARGRGARGRCSARSKARAEAQACQRPCGGGRPNEACQDLRLRVVEAYRRAALAHRVVERRGARPRAARVPARPTWRRGSARARPSAPTSSACGLDVASGRPTWRSARADGRDRDRAALAHARARTRASPTGPRRLPPAPPPLRGRRLVVDVTRPRRPARSSRGARAGRAARSLVRARRGARELARPRGLGPAPGRPQRLLRAAASRAPSACCCGGTCSTRPVASAWPRPRRRRAPPTLDGPRRRRPVRLEVETAWRRARAARERYAAAAGGAEEGREALRVVRSGGSRAGDAHGRAGDRGGEPGRRDGRAARGLGGGHRGRGAPASRGRAVMHSKGAMRARVTGRR